MRLSRGRSTPTRRAMLAFLRGRSPQVVRSGVGRVASQPSWPGLRPSAPEVASPVEDGLAITMCGVQLWCCRQRVGSALALLVTRVLADHHDAAVATDHLALVTDRLDARVDLHVSPFLLGSAAARTYLYR